MNSALMFGICLAAALFLQTWGSLAQYKRVTRDYQEIRKRNAVVSVGKSTYRGMNRTAVLGFNSSGILNEAYILSDITVFAKLKPLSGHDGEHYSAVKDYYSKDKRMACVVQAVRYMEGSYD